MMSETPDTTPLYRIENPAVPAHPDGIVSHEKLVGQWFTPNLNTAMSYLRKSTQTFGRDAHPIDGARLVIAQVPTEQLNAMHVSHHPIATGMDVENDNYIVPRDGTVPTETVALDGIIGDLRGQLGRFDKLKEAKQRLARYLGDLTASQSQ